MLGEAIGSLTCALESQFMAENTILALVSDNGGEEPVIGNTHPIIGSKGSFYRSGLIGTGLIHSKLLPGNVRGQSYTGQMHVTDWYPTLMGLITNSEWTGSIFGVELVGVNHWDAMTTPNLESPRSEIVLCHDGLSTSSIQIDLTTLNLGDILKHRSVVEYIFAEDLYRNNAATLS